MSRHVLQLNHNWQYVASFDEQFLSPDYNTGDWATVTIPHTNIEVPYNNFDEKMFQFVSCYRNTIELDAVHRHKRIFLDFEGVMTYAEVYLNGELLGSHKGGYTPFSVELTGKIDFEIPNSLAVRVDSTEREDIPPFGGSIDYLTFGGIYREVSMRLVAPIYLENVFVRPQKVLEDRKAAEYSLFLKNSLETSQTLLADVCIKDGDTVIAKAEQQIEIDGRSQEEFVGRLTAIADVTLWDIDNPKLYDFDVTIRSADKTIEDRYSTRFGFRTAEVTPTGFFLNGKKIMLRGLNRHQTFPYVGQAMPARVQRKDADILKHELHLNLTRTSHYPQSKHFLDRCDEIGLLVLEEIPGWQHIGDDAWKQVACENVREMIQHDWNHPSIILWGVRINESPDDREFYAETNRIAHTLDTTRQSCGIRCIPNSELLEDVYTMNDFSHSGGELVLKEQQQITGLGHLVPYITTEFNGHMYPTKRFDQEERLIEHALRHARVQSRAAADEQISGAIGWCAFDYNTHYNFGSGDRICYHGVMDMYRLPKMAAQVYRSQVAPTKDIVLEPATLWTRGDRSIGGVIPLTIFTNCDEIEFFYGGKFVGKYTPATDRFPGLEYPPVIIEIPPEELGVWGLTWENGRFIGYVNGKQVIEKTFINAPVPTSLIATVDDAELQGDGIDATRIVYKMVDQVGNVTPYIHDFLKLEISGPGDIIGATEVPLIGGCVAVWVKTQQQTGNIILSASSLQMKGNDVVIKVTG